MKEQVLNFRMNRQVPALWCVALCRGVRAVALAFGVVLTCQAQAQQAEGPEAAVEEMQTARTDVPQWVLDGSALLSAGKAEEAATLFEKLLAAEPGNAPARYWLGEAYLAQGQMNKARAAFAASLKADPNHQFAVDAHIRLADPARDAVAEPPVAFPRAGTEIKDCAKCPAMVVVPAGSFVMGYPPGDSGRFHQEGPVRTVTFAKPFAIGKFEVTFDEWDACTAEKQCPKIDDKGRGRGRRPAMYVSWDQAAGYARWLSKKTGRHYRLLTEAEWEYAARAGVESRYRFWGIAPDRVCTIANVYDKTARKQDDTGYENLPCDDRYAEAAPVGSFKPNAFGLYDMLGNVSEWTEDCLPTGLQWRGAPLDGTANLKGDCSQRAYRGGSWFENEKYYMRSPDRYKFIGARDSDLGFRVARMLP
jgi:formylglycine-generating enzyme required for sulfatase activity